MAEVQPAAEGASIVLRGHFNPAIISPGWLAGKGLLGESEAEDISDQTILPRASLFAVSWLRCEVTDDRFALHTSEPLEYSRLRDVAVGVLDSLSETPLALLGLNRFFHFPVATSEQWHSIGDALVPKEIWKDLLYLPGTRTITIEGSRTDEFLGYVRVKVEPSNAVENGLFIEVNDHVVLEKAPRPMQSREDFVDPAIKELLDSVQPSVERVDIARLVLAERFDDTLDRSAHIAEGVIARLLRKS